MGMLLSIIGLLSLLTLANSSCFCNHPLPPVLSSAPLSGAYADIFACQSYNIFQNSSCTVQHAILLYSFSTCSHTAALSIP